MITELKKIEDIDNLKSGDFVELKSNIKINTIVESFETLDKVIDITEVFASFANVAPNKSTNDNAKYDVLSGIKEPVKKTVEVLTDKSNNIKYGVCKLEGKDLAIRLNRNYFINGDYSEIKNGEFRIIGKVLEIVKENESIILNRENAIGLYDPEMLRKINKAFESVLNINFDDIQDKVEGKTIVIMPIAICI